MSARHLDRMPGIRPAPRHPAVLATRPRRLQRRARADALRDRAQRRERLAAIGCYLLALAIPAAYFAAAWLHGWRP